MGTSFSHTQVHPLLGALHAAMESELNPAGRAPASCPAPFVTVSRQAGAGGRTFAQRLVERLNAMESPNPLWTAWDKELIEKVAAEHGLSADDVAVLEDRKPNWLEELLEGFGAGRPHPAELRVFRDVAVTIRAIARVGHAVIVGRGGVFVTAGMPGGFHVRLVAPLEHRIKSTASCLSISLGEAAKRVSELDRNRETFYRRHWPERSMSPEDFSLTLNTAELTEDQLVRCVLPLVEPDSGCGAKSIANVSQ